MKSKNSRDTRDASRRKLIKSLGISSGVVATSALIPKTWTKPIVESVVLPAHAQTSQAPTIFASTSIPANGNASILDGLVSSAYADHQIYQICAEPNGSSATVTLQNIVDNFVRRQGTIPLDGTAGDMNVIQSCREPGQQTVPGRITSVSSSSLTFVLERPNRGDLVAILPLVGFCPPFPDTDGCGVER